MKVAFYTSGVASQQDVLMRGSSRVRHAFATPKNVSVGGGIECYLSSGYFCCFFSFRREERKENELQGGHYDRRLHWGSNRLAESGRRLLSPAGCWMKGNLQLGCEIAMFGSQEVIFSQVIFMIGRRNYCFCLHWKWVVRSGGWSHSRNLRNRNYISEHESVQRSWVANNLELVPGSSLFL